MQLLQKSDNSSSSGNQFFWGACCVLGAWFGFANPLLQLPLLVLAFPLGLSVLALRAASPRGAFKSGYLAGLLAYAGCIYWVSIPVHDFGGMPWILAAPCPLLLGAFLGLYPGAFCLAARLAKDRLPWLLLAVFCGALWGVLEFLRGWIFTGFPWCVLPAAFVPWPFAIQGVSVVGSYGLSAFFVFCIFLAAMAFSPASRIRPAFLGILLLGGVFAWGAYGVAPLEIAAAPQTVTLVQGNINQAVKWDPEFQEGTIQRYAQLSEHGANEQQTQLIIWPETSMPFFFQKKNILSEQVRAVASRLHTCVLFGSPAFQPVGEDGYVLFNRAYLLNKEGKISGFYDKEHLVPFGEYVPLNEYLPFLKKLVAGIGDFKSGHNATPLQCGNLALGMLICYEAIFPELAQQRVEQGANVLVNISNDAWYGRSSAALQHLHLSALRAVEQRRYLARGTNTGISAIVDPQGKLLVTSDLFRAQSVHQQLRPVIFESLFHRIYYAVMPTLAAITLLLGLFAFFRSPNN